jgi:hypothetical protein
MEKLSGVLERRRIGAKNEKQTSLKNRKAPEITSGSSKPASPEK